MSSARAELIAAITTADSNYEKADYTILLATIDALHGKAPAARQDLADATRLLNSPANEIRIARVYAMIGDHAVADGRLDRLSKDEAKGLDYGAARSFVDGMDAVNSHDFVSAANHFATSLRIQPNPETAFFHAEAAMDSGDWAAAVKSLEWILNNKTMVLEDSVGSLIPLAEFKLSACYKRLGNEDEAAKHLRAAQSWWKESDADVRDQLAVASIN